MRTNAKACSAGLILARPKVFCQNTNQLAVGEKVQTTQTTPTQVPQLSLLSVPSPKLTPRDRQNAHGDHHMSITLKPFGAVQKALGQFRLHVDWDVFGLTLGGFGSHSVCSSRQKWSKQVKFITKSSLGHNKTVAYLYSATKKHAT